MITVKPLEWKQTVIGDGTVLRQNAWLASYYQIIESPSGKYDLRGDTYAICDTLEEAQAAAFADYSARIMSAIEPAGVVVETYPAGQPITVDSGFGPISGVILENVEGWWKVQFIDGSCAIVRPSSVRAALTKEATHD